MLTKSGDHEGTGDPARDRGRNELSQWFESGQLDGDAFDHPGYYGIMRKPR